MRVFNQANSHGQRRAIDLTAVESVAEMAGSVIEIVTAGDTYLVKGEDFDALVQEVAHEKANSGAS